MGDPQRHVEFEACFNFRDLGGYPTTDGGQVRWGTLYRSDTLHRLTEADAEVFRALGLHTVIDLRSGTELDDHGRLDPAHEDDVAWHHVAMLDNLRLAPRAADETAPPIPLPADDVKPGEGYLAIAEQFGTSLARVFELLAADDALPAVFHCTSGKDRTGIVAALMLDLLGVDDDVIADDYVLTAESRARSAPWIQANEPEFAAFLRQIPPERRVIDGETILGFLELARAKYGSGRDFLLHLGVPDADLDALRVRLVS